MGTIKDRWKSLQPLNFSQFRGKIFLLHSLLTNGLLDSTTQSQVSLFAFMKRKVSCDVKIFLPVVVITLPVARARSVQLRHLS